MSETIIETQNVTKRFPGVVALDNVNFSCERGEVHALVGENGAGKTTLIKILAGVYQQDEGEILLRGEPIKFHDPHHAQALGISIIYQELNLLPDLNVAENVFLGREPRSKLGFINRQELEKQASEALNRLGVDIDPRTPLRQLSVARQQMVEIAKALSLNAELVIMDEPSATLGGQDLQHVFDVISALKQQNVAVIYISHRIAEVFEVADRVTVLKDGKVVDTKKVADIERVELVRMMIGRTFSESFPPRAKSIGEKVLTIEKVSSGRELSEVSFDIHAGEIVGIAGFIGSGRTELAQCIFGVRPVDNGSIRIVRTGESPGNPRQAMENKIGYLTEDRKAEGLVLDLSVRHNVALPSLRERQRWGFVRKRKEAQIVGAMINKLACRTPSLKQEVQYLSGGNQQKVVLAKWLVSEPELLIFDEPTRGIDVGAKSEIWHLMRELADQGTAILMISSELPEIIGMSDRVIVMHRGRIAGELSGDEATEEKVLMLSTYGELHE